MAEPKPELYTSEYGTWFQDPLVVEAYPARPPYPDGVIEHLVALSGEDPRAILDVGCGPGDLARRLAPRVQRIDALDASAGMLAVGRTAAGGDAPNLRWIHARVEDPSAALQPPYTLITAGESLHWFDWELVMPRFAEMLTPPGVLAMVDRSWNGPPTLHEKLVPIFKRFAAVRTWQNVSLLEELGRRQLFDLHGQQRFGPEPWQPTVDEYILARFSQRSFSRTHIGPDASAAFAAALREALADIPTLDGRLQLEVSASISWGRPRG